MKIGILTSNPKTFSVVRLRDAAKAKGHNVRILNLSEFSIIVESHKPALLYRGKPFPRVDAVIPRIGASSSFFGTAIVRQFEQTGIYVLNASYGLSIAHDKLRTLQILSRHKVGIPLSCFVFNKADTAYALKTIGGAPVVLKLLRGTQGKGVILADTDKIAQAMVEALHAADQNVLMQHFVEESRGNDIRAFVVGDRVVAAMRRKAVGDEFRSNVHLGGETEYVTLDSHYEQTAIQAAHIVGLRVAGVDILESDSGPLVMEVNASPGLEGIEGASNIDIAAAIIDYLEDQIVFPDVDIRERLSIGRGYGVVEVPVLKKSPFANKTIAESKFQEQEIQVLSIIRNTMTLPSPSQQEHIVPGDKLICFGKQLTLKSLIPTSARKALRKKPAAAKTKAKAKTKPTK